MALLRPDGDVAGKHGLETLLGAVEAWASVASVRGGNVLGVGARVGGARPWRGGPCGRWHWPHGGRCGAGEPMRPCCRAGAGPGAEVLLWKHGRGVRAKARDRKKISRAPNASGALLACFFERYLTGTGPTSTCAGPEDRLSAAHEAWPRSRSEAARPSRRSATRRWSPGSDHPPPRRNRNRAPAQFPGQSPRERTVPLHEEKPGWSGRRRSLPTGDYQCRSSSPSSRTPFPCNNFGGSLGVSGSTARVDRATRCRPQPSISAARGSMQGPVWYRWYRTLTHEWAEAEAGERGVEQRSGRGPGGRGGPMRGIFPRPEADEPQQGLGDLPVTCSPCPQGWSSDGGSASGGPLDEVPRHPCRSSGRGCGSRRDRSWG